MAKPADLTTDGVSDTAASEDLIDHDQDTSALKDRPGRTISLDALRSAAIAVVAVLAVAALIVWGANRVLALHHDDRVGDDRQGALVAARSEVLALTTISSKTSADDIKKLLAGAAPSFRSEFEKQAAQFTAALKQAGVVSKGSVASAGVQSSRNGKAVILVAATGTVTNANSKKAEPRNYRLRVSLEKTGNRWLVSGMDFVA